MLSYPYRFNRGNMFSVPNLPVRTLNCMTFYPVTFTLFVLHPSRSFRQSLSSLDFPQNIMLQQRRTKTPQLLLLLENYPPCFLITNQSFNYPFNEHSDLRDNTKSCTPTSLHFALAKVDNARYSALPFSLFESKRLSY